MEGLSFSLFKALCIDKRDAFKIFILFISSTLAIPKAYIEFFLIYSESINLFLKGIFFESLMSFLLIFLFKITAAANTGPAKHPRPTSSTPATLFFLNNNFIFLNF